MAIIYKTCTISEDLTHTCDPCGEQEMGNVRSIVLIDPDAGFVSAPIVKATWEAAIEAGTVIIVPETRGSFDGGTPKYVPGYGNLREKLIGMDYMLPFKDPNLAANAEFWEGVEKKPYWHIAFRTATQLFLITDAEVHITAKSPVEEDVDTAVVWNCEAKWFSKTKPQILAVSPIIALFKCFEVGELPAP